ncbi:hypothetical protein G7085_13970 [Tessaracoccus sp. HDW20]|uniref:hypothetical protein n=1 Tax=Tessaracoccus coleopterorum TaxID=2714950 RepID=UPI0018D4A82E|nr:hypothetical protein [Tessaracoccus coleopterorum]NHB85352.1 hypothetical protein [Tessaracoccus coleopterorum]
MTIHIDAPPARPDSGFAGLLARVGWPYIIASALARLPQSMLTIGALTYVAAGSGDFTTPASSPPSRVSASGWARP